MESGKSVEKETDGEGSRRNEIRRRRSAERINGGKQEKDLDVLYAGHMDMEENR